MITQLGDDYIAAFNPKAYLQECYTGPDEEHIFNIQFLVEALRQLPPHLRVLEVGGGPTLHSVAVVAPHAREIHCCDYVPANLAEIRRWLNGEPDTFDWDPFIAVALEKEGRPVTPETIASRVAAMRRKVTCLATCDVCQPQPLGLAVRPYDLVLAPHCTDVAATTRTEWRQVLRHVSTLVKPGGWLFIAVTTGTTINTVGSRVFACVDLTDQDICDGYLAAGFKPHTIRLAKIPADNKYEFTGVAYAIAQKKQDSTIQDDD